MGIQTGLPFLLFPAATAIFKMDGAKSSVRKFMKSGTKLDSYILGRVTLRTEIKLALWGKKNKKDGGKTL